MSGLMTKKEKYHVYNSLICLAKSLENRCTTVDLRNETCVTGKIKEVDGYMNLTMSDAAFYDTDGRYHYFPFLFIQARNIRNIHIPDNVPIKKTLKDAVAPAPVPVRKEKSAKTFKQIRAERKQLETLKLITEMKSQREKGIREDEKND